jgi:hypothetical protein
MAKESGTSGEGSSKEKQPAAPHEVHLFSWTEGRGVPLESQLRQGIEPHSRRSIGLWHEGKFEEVLPYLVEKLSEASITNLQLDDDLENRFEQLKGPLITLFTGEEEEDAEPETLNQEWVQRKSPLELVALIHTLCAQRDAAVSAVADLRKMFNLGVEMLKLMTARVRAFEHDGHGLEREQALEQQVEDLLAEKAGLEDERVELMRKVIARMDVRPEPEDLRSPPRQNPKQQTPDPPKEGVSTRKTAKIADPEKFTNGKNPKFSVWKAQVLRKIRGNSELFPTDASKFGYAVSYIAGDAMESLEPFLEDDAIAPITTLDELFEFLRGFYKDPTEQQRAKNDFRDLTMKQGQSFREFLTQFVQEASKAQISKAEWKDELNQRLNSRLQYGMTPHFIDPRVDFDEFARLGHQYSLQYDVIEKQKKKNQPGGSSQGGSGGKGKDKAGSPAQGGKGKSPAPTDAEKKEREELREAGKCFYCKEVGHVKSQCPKRLAASIKQLKAKLKEKEESGTQPQGEKEDSEN